MRSPAGADFFQSRSGLYFSACAVVRAHTPGPTVDGRHGRMVGGEGRTTHSLRLPGRGTGLRAWSAGEARAVGASASCRPRLKPRPTVPARLVPMVGRYGDGTVRLGLVRQPVRSRGAAAAIPLRDTKPTNGVLGKAVEALAERLVVDLLPERQQPVGSCCPCKHHPCCGSLWLSWFDGGVATCSISANYRSGRRRNGYAECAAMRRSHEW